MRRTPRCSGLLGVLLLASCFVGDAADGLPCEVDADCGIGVACTPDPEAEQSCCGGSCSVAPATGTVGTSTTSTSTSTSTGSSSGSSSTTGSESTGPQCGNGVVEEGEDCDGGENPNCDDECRLPTCGNAVVDDGELCDIWPPSADEECLPGCKSLVVFDWDNSMTIAEADAAFCEGGLCQRWALAEGMADPPMGSGVYYDGEPTVAEDLWPEALLRTRPIAMPALIDGDEVRFEVDHRHRLNISDPDGQAAGGNATDYGIVALQSAKAGATDQPILLLPTSGNAEIRCGQPQPTDDCLTPGEPPPYCDFGMMLTPRSDEQPGFTGGPDEDALVQNLRVLGADALPTGPLELEFRLRYDCGNYTTTPEIPAENDAWRLFSVRVTVMRDGG